MNATLEGRRKAAVARGVGIMLPLFVARAENAELWDVEGKRYIDFASGIGVVAVGHRNRGVVDAVRAQLDSFIHACFQVTPYESYVALAERLNELTPGTMEKKTLLLNTGAEALENAVKIARAYTGRPAIVALRGGFHGRTFMALAMTGKVAPYKLGFGPFPAEVYHAPFPCDYRGPSGAEALAELEGLFKADVDPARVAAIVVEPVQGEGGFNVAPPAYLQGLRSICDRHGIVLIVDEVQTGFGRTGRLFAIEHSGVVPDLIATAKALGGGLPLAAVTGRSEIMDAPAPGGLGGTYAGNPLACAAAHAVLDCIERERLVERAEALGGVLKARLEALARVVPAVGHARGLGAMRALELVTDRKTKEPAPELTQRLVQRAAERGLVMISCGVYGNVLRFLIPLTAREELVTEGLDIFETTLREVCNG